MLLVSKPTPYSSQCVPTAARCVVGIRMNQAAATIRLVRDPLIQHSSSITLLPFNLTALRTDQQLLFVSLYLSYSLTLQHLFLSLPPYLKQTH